MVLLCDANHALSSDTSEIRVIGAGADAAITCLRFSPDRPEPAEKYLRLFCRKADGRRPAADQAPAGRAGAAREVDQRGGVSITGIDACVDERLSKTSVI